jgi:hypothetical protein
MRRTSLGKSPVTSRASAVGAALGLAVPVDTAGSADSLRAREAFVSEMLGSGLMPSGRELAGLARACVASSSDVEFATSLLGRIRSLPMNRLMSMRLARRTSGPLCRELITAASQSAEGIVECGNLLSDEQLLEAFGQQPMPGVDYGTPFARSAADILHRVRSGKLGELRFEEVLGLTFRVGYCLPGSKPSEFIPLRSRVDGISAELIEQITQSVVRLEQLTREYSDAPGGARLRRLSLQTREVRHLFQQTFWDDLQLRLCSVASLPNAPETLPLKVFISSLVAKADPLSRRAHTALAGALTHIAPLRRSSTH